MHSDGARIYRLIRCLARTKKQKLRFGVGLCEQELAICRPMPTSRHAALRALRMKYNAANSAYQDCVRVRTEATMSGGALSLEQVEREVAALRTLNRIRDELLAAMTESAGQSPGD